VDPQYPYLDVGISLVAVKCEGELLATAVTESAALAREAEVCTAAGGFADGLRFGEGEAADDDNRGELHGVRGSGWNEGESVKVTNDEL
jgi:hypothetical protein